MKKTLNDLKPGQCGIVGEIIVAGAIKRRFLDMGITSGTKVEMDRSAPFGDPIAIKVRGYNLSLRRSEACNIMLR